MALGRNLEESLQNAVRSLEIDEDDLISETCLQASDEEVENRLVNAQDDLIFYLAEAFRRGYSLEEVHELTKIDRYFLDVLIHIVEIEKDLAANVNDLATLKKAKRYGFSDLTIAKLWQTTPDDIRQFRLDKHVVPVYKVVDTCAAEFASDTP